MAAGSGQAGALQARERVHPPAGCRHSQGSLAAPTHDNIKQVVEMKFPDDPYRPGQREDYIRIAGGATKLVDLRIDDCDCSESEPEKSKVPVEELGKAAAIMRLLYVVITRRPPPRGVPAF